MLGKILFITSASGGLPQGMVYALRRMKTDYKEVPIWEMTQTYNELKPSTMIFFHHFLKEWNEKIVKEIEAIPCHKIYWDWEMPWEIDYINKYHGLFGYILVQDKSSKQALDNRMNNKVIFVPHAADPDSCPHIENVPFKYRSDLVFIGAAYPSRMKFFRQIISQLKDYKVIIAGWGYEMIPDMQTQLLLPQGALNEEYGLYTNGAKVVLNLHRESDELTMSNNEHVKASSPNNRLFEVNMMGKFQMTDRSRAPEIFDYYPSAVTFDSPNEFVKQFKLWVRDDSGRHQMEQKSREHTLKFHTYENRFATMIAPLI